MNTNKQFSKNKKLNNILTAIYNDLLELSPEEVRHYKKEFPNEIDFNIAQYGSLLCYYSDIYNLYRTCGYKSTDEYSQERIWNTYKRQVGYIARWYF